MYNIELFNNIAMSFNITVIAQVGTQHLSDVTVMPKHIKMNAH